MAGRGAVGMRRPPLIDTLPGAIGVASSRLRWAWKAERGWVKLPSRVNGWR